MNSYPLYRILNDPLSYIHKDRFKYNEMLTRNIVNRVVLNELIFEIYDLKYDSEDITSQDMFWICNWGHIRHIIYILGCLTLRNELLKRGSIIRIPMWGFNAIKNIPCQSEKKESKIENLTDVQILNEGFCQIKGIMHETSVCLQKRMKLMFADHIDNCNSATDTKSELLNMVSLYVKSNRFRREVYASKWDYI